MTIETQQKSSEESHTPNGTCTLGIIQVLKEDKINELKKMATEMKMNFDDELYKQIENLKDSEIDMLTKFLLRWLTNPEKYQVHYSYPQVSTIAEKIANYKNFRTHINVANMFFNYNKYPVFNYNTGCVDQKVLGKLIHSIDLRDRSDFKLEDIKNFNENEVGELLKFLKIWLNQGKKDVSNMFEKVWLNQGKIDVSNMSEKVLKIFSNITKYEDLEKYRKFIKELFRRGILDKKYVVDIDIFRDELKRPNDITKYEFLKSYQCRAVAGVNGQFKGVVFRMPDGCIYQISVDKDNERSWLIDFLVSLGFEN